jgi:hypothetical protein
MLWQGRPASPLDVSERELFIGIAGLAGAVMTSLRRPGRGKYESENSLRAWLKGGGVSFSASTGKLIRPKGVPPKSPRPGVVPLVPANQIHQSRLYNSAGGGHVSLLRQVWIYCGGMNSVPSVVRLS